MGRAGRHRPMLLVLVYGVFLVLVGITASALVVVASAHLSSATLDAIVSRDGAMVELALNQALRPADLELAEGPASSRRAHALERHLRELAAEADFLRIDIRSADGIVLLSSLDGQRAAGPPLDSELRDAPDGGGSVALLDAPAGLDGVSSASGSVVRELLPLRSTEGQAQALVAIWRDAGPVLARLDAARRDIMLVTLVASALLAALLFAVFRAAQARISGQRALLLEAERRDGLTGLLNHGAVVTLVAEAVEQQRAGGGSLGVALVDVDNFRLLNETHGHDAGDDVLLRVADLVVRVAGEAGLDGVEVSRYGPDEFLLVCPGAGSAAVEEAVDLLRRALSGVSVRFGDSEPLPVTVSAGICEYPAHAGSVTDLLSAAAVAVGEARASGGDAVRVHRTDAEEQALAGSFDVLHGLVIAVDTKDRYTKRHSEDVARYAVFLAQRLGLDEETVRTIHLAGLLHDIGKIGIPDGLLRKPSKLTAEEFAVFQQHVVLGDAIVRDVPNVDEVRTGIRYHHERWDGRGYVEGLDGEGIPLIGRILAVADAFSAMTTTRPYRKALSVEEALKRLGDAAGSQLQEELVSAFIAGIEAAPDAPLPGEEPAGLWRPQLWVA